MDSPALLPTGLVNALFSEKPEVFKQHRDNFSGKILSKKKNPLGWIAPYAITRDNPDLVAFNYQPSPKKAENPGIYLIQRLPGELVGWISAIIKPCLGKPGKPYDLALLENLEARKQETITAELTKAWDA